MSNMVNTKGLQVVSLLYFCNYIGFEPVNCNWLSFGFKNKNDNRVRISFSEMKRRHDRADKVAKLVFRLKLQVVKSRSWVKNDPDFLKHLGFEYNLICQDYKVMLTPKGRELVSICDKYKDLSEVINNG